MPARQVTVTNAAPGTVLGGGGIESHVIIKNFTAGVTVYLIMGEVVIGPPGLGSPGTRIPPVADATCYRWAVTDGPLGIDIPGGCALVALSSGANQVIDVLSDRL